MVEKAQVQVIQTNKITPFESVKTNVSFLYFFFVGYGNWQMERSQDEVFMAGQEGGQHRDAQGRSI